MSSEIKIKVGIRTDKQGSECEDEIIFDRKEWESMTDDEKEEACKDTALQRVDWWFEEVSG